MTPGRHRQPGIAVAHDVDRDVTGPAAGGRDGAPHGRDVVVVAGERQVDRQRGDAELLEPVHDEQPAPPRVVGAVDEQHRGTGPVAARGHYR